MRILAIDIGTRAGVAIGASEGPPPHLEAWLVREKGDSHERGAANLACALRDVVNRFAPELIAVEQYLDPFVQRSSDSIIGGLLAHGAVEAVAALYGVRCVRPAVNDIRRHFIGQVSVKAPGHGRKRTAKQRDADRAELNRMIVERAILLGYLEKGATDWDKANAAACFDYAAARYARKIPAALVMFGEKRA